MKVVLRPIFASNEEALKLIAEAVTKAGYELGTQIALALDVAATRNFTIEKLDCIIWMVEPKMLKKWWLTILIWQNVTHSSALKMAWMKMTGKVGRS